jgi:hypothetical protein
MNSVHTPTYSTQRASKLAQFVFLFHTSFVYARTNFITTCDLTVQHLRVILTLSLPMSWIYGAPCKARNFKVVYMYVYMDLRFGNAESRLFLFAAQCFNNESLQKVILCHSCV